MIVLALQQVKENAGSGCFKALIILALEIAFWETINS